LFEGIKILNDSTMDINWLNLFFGFFAALLSGILAIKLIVYLAEHKSFMPFVVYRIILGILILLFLL
jgi:undecaprenyl-diphosphatase